MATQLETFGEYLERAFDAGIIDFHLRVMMSPEGLMDFYIHPSDRDGETADFGVSAAFVHRLACAAGSSRPVIQIVGSADPSQKE